MLGTIGDVIATSGKAISGKRIMDWALIRLVEKSSSSLCVQQDVRRPRSPIPITLWRHRGSRTARVPDCSIRLPGKGWYAKLGRTTGVTSGLCNKALTYYNWKEKSTIQYGYRGKVYTRPIY
ncbi:uncharacterized protein ACHE_60466A [Aspergillus chevalieri]|uniref:Uncharacterized protein n=1 Tax=Aspergillus chevalieri TaxID=182096 RepID=A0A7R7VTS4_ASPCH|nr:uncharacterized protein ACHE_60466A [Aspergillus chevalieri]BCR90580.1 hypothetical protein ACHE_60466A [Aspergillus chevalieri]